jgi:hypothetical protein
MTEQERDASKSQAGHEHARSRVAGLVVGGLAVVAVGLGVAALRARHDVDVAARPQAGAPTMPPQDVIEECNRQAARTLQRLADAPEGAIVAEGDTSSGTLLGANAESRSTPATRTAYRHCMEMHGW